MVAGIRAPHQYSLEHILYALECVAPTVYKWVEGLLVALKEKLTKCCKGELKQFGYKYIVVSLF